MRIVLLTVSYKDTVTSVYRSKPELNSLSYIEQKKIVDEEISIWTSGWENALKKKGIEVFSIPINVTPLQTKWAEENNYPSNDIHEIAFNQVNKFKPDILWYDYFDIPLIRKIKSEISSIKLILGWTGSYVVSLEILKEVDLVLSCAPEAVDYLIKRGFKSLHLNHAFNPINLKRPEEKKIINQFSFIGQIFRGKKHLHKKREELLKLLADELNLKIYSPTYNLGLKDVLISLIKKGASISLASLARINYLKNEIERNKFLRNIIDNDDRPIIPYDFQLKKKTNPPVFGSEMYNVIFESLIVLNIHADSSPLYASNMRLFETTGVGTCLLTDWKKNINDLFEEDEEIMTYKSNSECIEKAKWLLANPEKCLEIGKAGQLKTLSQHTYDKRIDELLEIVGKEM